jgi:hypothetical protein
VRRIGLAMAGAVGALVLAVPHAAVADTTGDTSVTFTVSAGALSITVPAPVNLGSGSPGATISGQMGPVNVTDARALLVATWTATVSSADFTTGGASAAETIPKADVSYWSGPATVTTGEGTFTPGQVTAAAAQSLSIPRTAFSLSAGVGNNSATWNPTLVVAVPAAAVGGLYTGRVTHSVAP